MHHDALTIVTAWQSAANDRDAGRLLGLSDVDIELVGPRGSSRGRELLREWLQRAGLHLATHRAWVSGSTVVLEQHGVWRAVDTGEQRGEAEVASVFGTANGLVIYFARYDHLDDALAAAGLDPEGDLVPGSPV